jgi:hypothetical protein
MKDLSKHLLTEYVPEGPNETENSVKQKEQKQHQETKK